MHQHKAKWTLTFIMLFCCLHLADTTSRAKATEKETIALITSTPKQSWKQHHIAQKLAQTMGKNEHRNVTHIVYENGVKTSMDLAKSSAAPVLENPQIKLVVIGDGVKDKAHLIKLIKEERPELLVFSIQHTPSAPVTMADVTIMPDYAVQAHAVPLMVKEMGASALIYLSDTPSEDSPADKMRFEAAQATCASLGIPFTRESLAESATGNNAGAARAISRKVSDLIKKHGIGTVFYATDERVSSHAIREIAKYKGYFINGCLISPLDPFKKALQLKNNENSFETASEIKDVEKAVIRTGNKGKEGSPLTSFDSVAMATLIHFGGLVLDKQASLKSARDLLESFAHIAPQSKWYVTPHSAKRQEQVYLIHQDYYIFGRGFMRSLNMQKIPEPVREIRFDSF